LATRASTRIHNNSQNVKPRAPIGLLVFAAARAAGGAAAYYFAIHGLTLAHYDARGHLIVARRVTDSLTPGWRQLGALWLPLPHLINAIPVMWDWNYRTGFSAVATNVLAMSIGLGAMAQLVSRRTGCTLGAVTASTIVLLNPGVLYLAGTPMTEPLLFAFCWLALNAADKRLDSPEHYAPLAHPGPWMAAAALTRYEAWPITAALTLLTALSRKSDRATTFVRLAVWPAGAAAAFLLLGRLALGRFFADADFFTADNPAAHHPLAALGQIFDGYVAIAGWPFVLASAAGLIVLCAAAIRTRSARPLLPLSLFAAALLPFTAFLDGHPYRVRYMIALAAASGPLVGYAIAAIRVRPWRIGAAAALVAATLWARPPLALDAPMTVEAQRETATQTDRAAVTEYLRTHYDGRSILASQNSLGHYMQELSVIGMPLRSFINAGNGDLWAAALAHPERHAGWIMIEELAEGGDELAALAKERPDFLKGFERVAAGGGAVLYKRKASP
jgi:hypothetical protein